MIDKSYFLNRLANGDNIDVIGEEVAAMMTEALAEHTVRQAEADREATKRELIEELIEIVQELAILEGMDPDDLVVSEEDVDQLIAAFAELFATVRDLKKLVSSLDTTRKAPKSDEDILTEFVKMFS